MATPQENMNLMTQIVGLLRKANVTHMLVMHLGDGDIATSIVGSRMEVSTFLMTAQADVLHGPFAPNYLDQDVPVPPMGGH